MAKVKTKNKWDNTTKTQVKIEKIVKILAVSIFLTLCVPTFIYIMQQFVKFFF